jgi:hypothetical protein
VGFHSHNGRARCRSAVIRPFIAGLTLFGGSGGMAPHPVSVRANVLDGEGSFTNSGWWPEGRWEWQFLKSTGATLDTADRNLMRVTDPISGATVYTDQRYSASPSASFVFYSAGTYIVRARYQNRDKVWSDWATSATITVAANTRTKRYVNGSTGSDSNDGTSSGAAKLTLGAALSLINANDFEIEIADDTTCNLGSAVAVYDYSGIYIHGSGGGTLAPIVTNNAGLMFWLGSDSVVDRVTVEYDGATRRGAVGIAAAAENVAILNVDFHEVDNFVSIEGPKGVLLFKCVQRMSATAYPVYASGIECLSIIGCDFQFGSTAQHTVRITTGASPAFYTAFVAVDYCDLDHNAAAATAVLRAYMRHLGAYRTKFAGGVVSLGNSDARPASQYDSTDYCLDQCLIDFMHDTALLEFQLKEDTYRVVVRSCVLDCDRETNFILVQDRSGGGTATVEGVRFVNCTLRSINGAGYARFMYQFITVAPVDFKFKACLFIHAPADWAGRSEARFDHYGTGTTFEDCVYTPHEATKGHQHEVLPGGTDYDTAAEVNGEAWADGMVEEAHGLSATYVPSGVGTDWLTAARSMTGTFADINGVEWVAAGPVGCSQPEA